jgi:hypothetical protein
MKKADLVQLLHIEAELGVMDDVVLDAVVDVGDLTNVVLVFLLVVDCLQQLAPSIEHQQQPAHEPWLHGRESLSRLGEGGNIISCAAEQTPVS